MSRLTRIKSRSWPYQVYSTDPCRQPNPSLSFKAFRRTRSPSWGAGLALPSRVCIFIRHSWWWILRLPFNLLSRATSTRHSSTHHYFLELKISRSCLSRWVTLIKWCYRTRVHHRNWACIQAGPSSRAPRFSSCATILHSLSLARMGVNRLISLHRSREWISIPSNNNSSLLKTGRRIISPRMSLKRAAWSNRCLTLKDMAW